MSMLVSQLTLSSLYLVFGIVLTVISFKVADLPFKKAAPSAERFNSAFGLYLFFGLLSLALILSQVPLLISSARQIVKTGLSTNMWGVTIKLIFIFSGLSLVFWVICHYVSVKSVVLVKKKASLWLEIVSDQKTLVFFYGGINLLLSYLLKEPFAETCKYFLPETGIPFYR